MAAKKGHIKLGGRQLGTPNKITSDIREKFRKLVDMFSAEQIYDDLMNMEPKDRVQALSGLSEYLVPKLARIEMDANVEVKNVSQTTIFQIHPKGN